MRALVIAAVTAAGVAIAATEGRAASAPIAPAETWSYGGMFGKFDPAAVRRGLQVYREVCAACHSLKLVAFRNLQDLGFTEDEVQAIASEYEVEDGPDDEGEMFFRPAKASDRFPPPFENDNAARAANNGALPPDLSLITKARAGEYIFFGGTKLREYGSDYLFALLTGYEEDAPEGVELMDGMYYNHWFAGHQIAMAPPLSSDLVEYADGTPVTVDQMARDVTTFLAWAADPNAQARRSLGVKVILFLIFLTAMLYALKKQIWSDVH